ncbi:hypothetical protein [Alishewanella phage vB_AspM_Slickus01]|nr:hypothetical protein [Alishewanella phage vB_AspM_Slickus01]
MNVRMNVEEVKAPAKISEPNFSVFLAGAIDMGIAEPWQERLVAHFNVNYNGRPVTLLNPRRDDWDASWTQSKSNAKFSEQVNWELDGILSHADVVFFYFPRDSKAPISLLELGLALAEKLKIVVLCHPDFYRRGNVEITCNYYNVPVYLNWQDAITALENTLYKI